jgi:glycosyltransferase involved in cell wall biosynthesis
MRQTTDRLVVIETHPVQYHAPVYRMLQQEWGIPVTAIYGSDFSIRGYHDREFAATFAWDSDLLAGYTSQFLQASSGPDGTCAESVSTRGLADALRAARPAAILLLGYSPRFHQLAFFHAWRTGVPLLFRGETTDHGRKRSTLKTVLRDLALRKLYGACRALLYVGQRSYEHYDRLHCPSTKLFFSPYCVDTTAFATDEDARAQLRVPTRGALDIDERQVVVLFSGKLSERKGVEILVRAASLLPADLRKQIVLLFLGDGALRSRLHELADATPFLRTIFLGFKNQGELSAFYHAADMLVLPSIATETWGLVVNDALHHGLPAIVSGEVGSAPDMIEPGITGEVCDAGCPESLAQALERLVPILGSAELRSRCRAKVDGYTTARAAEGIARALEFVWDNPLAVSEEVSCR